MLHGERHINEDAEPIMDNESALHLLDTMVRKGNTDVIKRMIDDCSFAPDPLLMEYAQYVEKLELRTLLQAGAEPYDAMHEILHDDTLSTSIKTHRLKVMVEAGADPSSLIEDMAEQGHDTALQILSTAVAQSGVELTKDAASKGS